jgi:hypothetical protein
MTTPSLAKPSSSKTQGNRPSVFATTYLFEVAR